MGYRFRRCVIDWKWLKVHSLFKSNKTRDLHGPGSDIYNAVLEGLGRGLRQDGIYNICDSSFFQGTMAVTYKSDILK